MASEESASPLAKLEKLLLLLWNRLEDHVPIGTIAPFGQSAPDDPKETQPKPGWLFCHGQSVSEDDYGALYDVIGTSFGSENKDHFNLPDLRGRFVRGVDHDAGRDPDAKDRTVLRENGEPNSVGSVQEDAFKKHHHPIQGHFHRFYRKNTKDNPPTFVEPDKYEKTPLPDTDAAGGSETRPKNIYVEWIIYAGAPEDQEERDLLQWLRRELRKD